MDLKRQNKRRRSDSWCCEQSNGSAVGCCRECLKKEWEKSIESSRISSETKVILAGKERWSSLSHLGQHNPVCFVCYGRKSSNSGITWFIISSFVAKTLWNIQLIICYGSNILIKLKHQFLLKHLEDMHNDHRIDIIQRIHLKER